MIDDPDSMKELKSIVGHVCLETAPAAIVVCSQDRTVYEGYSFEKEDYGAAVENMLLAVTALGYASVWLDGVLRIHDRGKNVDKFLKVPDGWKTSVILPIGRPTQAGKQNTRLSFEKRAAWNRFPQE